MEDRESRVKDFKSRIRDYENFLMKEEGRYERIREDFEQNNMVLTKLNLDGEILEKVNELFKKTSEFARNQAKRQIESLVTKCLQFVFENDIEFFIELEELRGKANAEFYVITRSADMEIKVKPELSKGGGVVDIVALALRIAFLETTKPKIQGPLILDEPAKHVSDEYIYNIAEFLKQNSIFFNRQIIMVTHNDFLSSIGTKSYRVDIKQDKTIVQQLELEFTS